MIGLPGVTVGFRGFPFGYRDRWLGAGRSGMCRFFWPGMSCTRLFDIGGEFLRELGYRTSLQLLAGGLHRTQTWAMFSFGISKP